MEQFLNSDKCLDDGKVSCAQISNNLLLKKEKKNSLVVILNVTDLEFTTFFKGKKLSQKINK